MSSVPVQTFEFVERVHGAATQGELDDLFADFLTRFGMGPWLCTRVSVEPTRMRKPFLKEFGRPPILWAARYKQRGYVYDDPVAQAILARDRAFYWSEALEDVPLNARQKTIFGEAKEFGFSSGIVVPIRIFDGSVYGVTIFGETTESDPEIRDAVDMAAQFYTGRSLALSPAAASNDEDSPAVLTMRQKQVAALLARGFKRAEIALALGISIKTVDFILSEARHRFGVNTNNQLVAQAIAAGEITPDGDPL